MRPPLRLIRNLHLAASPVIGAFVDSGDLRPNDFFLALVQWGVFPLVAAAGLARFGRLCTEMTKRSTPGIADTRTDSCREHRRRFGSAVHRVTGWPQARCSPVRSHSPSVPQIPEGGSTTRRDIATWELVS
jgi:hypothetical protein